MQQLNFTELVQWLIWQRSRRYNQVTQEVLLAKRQHKKKNNLEKVEYVQ